MLKLNSGSFFGENRNKLVFWGYLSVIVVLATYFCLWNPNGSIKHTDEAMHITVIQDMWYGGHYVPPQAQGEYYFNKPPLKMWFTIPLIKIFGDYNFTYRLLDGVAGVFSFILIFYLGRIIFQSWSIGFVAVLYLCGNEVLFGNHIIRVAVQDSLAFFLNLLVLVLGIRLIDKCSNKEPSFCLFSKRIFEVSLCALFVSFAFMTKLIVAFIPLFLLVIYAICEGKLISFVTNSKRALLIGMVIFLIFPGMYYLYLYSVYPNIWEYMERQTFGRLVTEGQHNKDDIFFYLRALFAKQLYGSSSLFALAFIGGIFFWLKDRNSKLLFLLAWIILIFFGFSFLRARLDHYLSPIFPAMALIVGYSVVETIKLTLPKINSAWRKNQFLKAFLLGGTLGVVISLGAAECLSGIIKVKSKVDRDSYQSKFNQVTDQVVSAKNSKKWHVLLYKLDLRDDSINFLSLKRSAKEDFIYASRLDGTLNKIVDSHQVQRIIKRKNPTILITNGISLNNLNNIVGGPNCIYKVKLRHQQNAEVMYVAIYSSQKLDDDLCKNPHK